ncbi:MAG: ComF family protein [Pseudomonadota bacterium]
MHLQVKAIDLSILSTALVNIGPKIGRLLPAQPCFLCGAMSHNGLCCAACTADLVQLSSQHCPICALPTHGGEICGRCLSFPPRFEHTVAAFSYRFPVNELIKALKFRESLILVNFLSDALAQRIEIRPDAVLAMPLHPLRIRERGFNQSQLLAQRITRRLAIPLLTGVIQRVRNTPPQSSLPWKERDKNIRHAFAITNNTNIAGKHIAIVDDVMTTGASVDEVAGVLKLAGACKVSIWVVARTLPHP